MRFLCHNKNCNNIITKENVSHYYVFTCPLCAGAMIPILETNKDSPAEELFKRLGMLLSNPKIGNDEWVSLCLKEIEWATNYLKNY